MPLQFRKKNSQFSQESIQTMPSPCSSFSSFKDSTQAQEIQFPASLNLDQFQNDKTMCDQQKYQSILAWFKSNNILEGHPQNIIQKNKHTQKFNIALKLGTNKVDLSMSMSGLRERRLKKSSAPIC